MQIIKLELDDKMYQTIVKSGIISYKKKPKLYKSCRNFMSYKQQEYQNKNNSDNDEVAVS
jgi:hypothetical protein